MGKLSSVLTHRLSSSPRATRQSLCGRSASGPTSAFPPNSQPPLDAQSLPLSDRLPCHLGLNARAQPSVGEEQGEQDSHTHGQNTATREVWRVSGGVCDTKEKRGLSVYRPLLLLPEHPTPDLTLTTQMQPMPEPPPPSSPPWCVVTPFVLVAASPRYHPLADKRE